MWTSSISLSVLSLLLPISLSPFQTLVNAQDDLIDCPDPSLETYLISLIDVLYWNGLTTSEELLVSISEINEGYSLLESLYTQPSTYTFLTPTDSAWQELNICPPFNGMTNQSLVELFALHLLQGDWEPGTLSQGNNVASTYLTMEYEMNLQASDSSSSNSNGTNGTNGTDVSGNESKAMQAVVLRKGQDGNSLIAQNEWSNATSWSGKVDASNQEDVLSNIVILPIDTVLTIPPNLTTALSNYALTNFSAALDIISAQDDIERLSQGGFTIFAPIDQAFTSDITSLLSNDTNAQSIIGNLYTTNYTLYSPQWSSSSEGDGEGFSISMNSGDQLTVLTNTSGSFVSLTDSASSTNTTDGTSTNWGTVLQSDITIENGVMHIIDTVLVSPNITSSANNTTNSTTDGTTLKSAKASGGSSAASPTSTTTPGSGNTVIVTSGAWLRTSPHGVGHVEQKPLVILIRSAVIGIVGYLMIASV